MLWRGASSWGYGLPGFCVIPRDGLMHHHTLVWPLELGSWTPTHWCGPSISGEGHPCFGVALPIGVMGSLALTWRVELP